jgi:hypothetical protein
MSTSKHLGWAHPCNLCTGAEHSRATSALGLGAPLPRSAPGLQMTLRSKHLAALDSTVAGDSDVKLIFGDSTMQASLLGTARKKLAFFPGAFSSGSQRFDRATKHGSGFTRGSIMCCPGRMQSAPSSELATVSSACNTSSSKPAQQTKNPDPHRFDTRGAVPRLVAATRFWPTSHGACAPVPEQFTRDYDPGELGDSEGWCAEQCSSDIILASAMP